MVGWPTVKAILGNAVAPGSPTATSPATGYDAQQTERPLADDRPGNLFEPVAGEQGVHGPFDELARPSSLQFRATKHRRLLGIAGVTAIAAAAVNVFSGGQT